MTTKSYVTLHATTATDTARIFLLRFYSGSFYLLSAFIICSHSLSKMKLALGVIWCRNSQLNNNWIQVWSGWNWCHKQPNGILWIAYIIWLVGAGYMETALNLYSLIGQWIHVSGIEIVSRATSYSVIGDWNQKKSQPK